MLFQYLAPSQYLPYKGEFKPSIFQQPIYDWLVHSIGNLLIDAKAGCGKTATIVAMANMIPEFVGGKRVRILFVAFNTHIVKELKGKLPKHVDVKTSHSLGLSVINWKRETKYNRDNGNIDKDKALKVLQEQAIRWGTFDEMEKSDAMEYLKRIDKLARLGRLTLAGRKEQMEALADKYNMDIQSDEVVKAIQLIKFMKNQTKTIDMVDMIYRPNIDNKLKFWKYDFIFVDEVQDLNRCQQELVKKFMHSKTRLIMVGDKHQAIYGFTGADTDSFDRLEKIPNTVKLPLNECYRCPPEHIALAQMLVPGIVAFKGNKPGKIDYRFSVNDLVSDDMVICRNTAPLISLCYHLIARKIKAHVKGKDIGQGLANYIERSKKSTIEALINWMKRDLNNTLKGIMKRKPNLSLDEAMKKGVYRNAEERMNIIITIIENSKAKNVKGIKDELNTIFDDSIGGVVLCTVHKCKGLEAERVMILQRDLMPSKYAEQEWELIQECNIEYVALTRSKSFLGFVADWNYGYVPLDDRDKHESDQIKVQQNASGSAAA